MASILSITVMDCGPQSDAVRREVEEAFRASLIEIFGSEENVWNHYQAANELTETYGEYPLPKEAAPLEKSVTDTWYLAECKAARAAFADWIRYPESAHFDIRHI